MIPFRELFKDGSSQVNNLKIKFNEALKKYNDLLLQDQQKVHADVEILSEELDKLLKEIKTEGITVSADVVEVGFKDV